jgi:type IV secretory pathway TraG/TraD family ATPase VirD4
VLRVRRVMDQSGILIINLSKGQLGEDTANLLGALLVTTLGLAAMSRANLPPAKRQPFFVYIDEFQSFTTESVANMVSELRKQSVGLILVNQHLFQLEPKVCHAVLGNVGTIISFRLGVEDAKLLEREFHPVFGWEDLINLPNYDLYIKLLIDGVPSRPFSATTFPVAQMN